MKKIIFATALGLFFFCLALGQDSPLPRNIQKAYDRGTRMDDGNPGPSYWQNSSDYHMDVTVDTEEDRITGSAHIKYANNSPDSLRVFFLRLYQDFFKKGNARQWSIPEEDLTEGMKISRLVIDDMEYNPEKDLPGRGMTNIHVRLKKSIAPGATARIEIEWGFDVPAKEGLRMKKYDAGHYFIAYWYPQIAVYDDIDGWDQVEYMGMVEFYNDINNYEVNITVPGDFVVWATGELRNMAEVVQPAIVERFEQAKISDDVIRIIGKKDLDDHAVTRKGKSHTWTYQATGVPDFSFALSNHSCWDGTSLEVDASTGRRVFTDVVYPEEALHWENGAELSRNAIRYMSEVLPGIPFPYPQMTSFCSGTRGGGMETPMMANDGAPRNYTDLAELLFHEIAHTYFPFYMGTNERKYAWMDEGWATYFPAEFIAALDPTADYFGETVRNYTYFAGLDYELPLMYQSYQQNNFSTAHISAYIRPAIAYHFLRDALGDPLFKKALKEFMERWNGKHPLPWDFFNTFESVAGEDLDWFWKPWFYDQGYPDLAIREVTSKNEVVIERIGTHPVPVSLNCQYEGYSEIIYRSVTIWKDGREEVYIPLPGNLKVLKIELGNDHIPDVNKSNNLWSREE